MDFRRSSISVHAEAVENPLRWLHQLQETDVTQVGQRLWSLSHIRRTVPTQTIAPNSFIIPDAVMQAVWRSIDGSNQILGDFPHLNLNVSPAQAVQIQLMSQALQRGILEQDLPPHWATGWQTGLCQAPLQPWILTPSLWTVSRTEPAKDLAPLLAVRPIVCKAEPEALWAGLKRLWAGLFQAQQLHIFHYLGLRPAQIHLSILVQPWVAVQTLGWLKVSPNQFEIEAVTVGESDRATAGWGWNGWPEFHCYDRRTQVWRDAVIETANGDGGATITHRLLSEATLRFLLEVGNRVPRPDYHPHPLTLTWGLPHCAEDAEDLEPQILSIAPDLPLPLHPRVRPSASAHRTAQGKANLPSGLPPRDRPGEWVGVGVSPGTLTAPVVVAETLQHLPTTVCRGSILVTRHLEPIHLAWLQEALGLLCVEGGQTSHGAILARELGCPAIVGLGEGILEALHTGQWVVLDGSQGVVRTLTSLPPQTAPFSGVRRGSTQKQSGSTKTQLLVNASQPNTLKDLQGIDGIGLLRGEWLLLGQLTPPYPLLSELSATQWAHLSQQMGEGLWSMAQAIAPRPLFYRSMDLCGMVGGLRVDASLSQNPALGLRGTLRSQLDAQWFERELTILADLIHRGVKNLRLVLPFVRSPQEVLYCVEKMRQVGLDPHQTLPLWMMAEVPSVLFALEHYQATGIQGITIGSSDLSQLLLGIDRDQGAFQTVFQHNASVILDFVEQLVTQATALQLPSILCGVLTQQPPAQWVSRLLGAGLTGISVEVDAVAQMRQRLVQIEQTHHNSAVNPWVRDAL